MNEIITDKKGCIKVSELKFGTLFQCYSYNGRFFMRTDESRVVDLEDGSLHNARSSDDADYENVEILNELTIRSK